MCFNDILGENYTISNDQRSIYVNYLEKLLSVILQISSIIDEALIIPIPEASSQSTFDLLDQSFDLNSNNQVNNSSVSDSRNTLETNIDRSSYSLPSALIQSQAGVQSVSAEPFISGNSQRNSTYLNLPLQSHLVSISGSSINMDERSASEARTSSLILHRFMNWKCPSQMDLEPPSPLLQTISTYNSHSGFMGDSKDESTRIRVIDDAVIELSRGIYDICVEGITFGFFYVFLIK